MAGALSGASGFIGCGAAVAGSLWRARQSRNVTTYGSARWAKPNEIDRAGLFNDAGVFLGRQRGRYLRPDGPEHVMAFAPTRKHGTEACRERVGAYVVLLVVDR